MPFMGQISASRVNMGGRGGKPYVPFGQRPEPFKQPGATTILGPESVRATGTGPFDAAYRQDLATYAGGLFQRPGGNLSFNPTNINANWGQPTGGGSAPVYGMPNTLAQIAIGGNPFSFTPPVPKQQQQWWWQQREQV